MIAKTYDALDNDVYNEKFLKSLMLSLEYEIREDTNNSFYILDNKLHMDHILPRAYNQKEEWNYIKDEEVLPIINSLGNMALLQDIKNEEALNCGFDNKIRIYKGQDEDGNNKSGITSFEYTRKIITDYDNGSKEWNLNQILSRKELLMKDIETMLNISRDDINVKLPEEESKGKNGKSKWLYNEIYYDNAKLVRTLIHDYIKDNKISSFNEIPEELRNFKMYSHELIIEDTNELIGKYSYTNIQANDLSLNIRSICQKDDTNRFIEILRNYYDFKLDVVNDNNE